MVPRKQRTAVVLDTNVFIRNFKARSKLPDDFRHTIQFAIVTPEQFLELFERR